MNQFKWLTKEDFGQYAQMTVNIDERFIDSAVNDALNFDLVPVVSDSMLDAVRAVLEINPIQWSRTKTYIIGNKVFSDGIYYLCLVGNSDSEPTSANTDWAEIELMTFWTNYIKPYFVMSAYSRFLLWHGANITQFGARQINEDTSTEITDKRRGELLADIKGKVNIYLSRLNKEFARVRGIFDSVTYTIDADDNTEPTRGTNIWGVGYPNRKRIKCPNEYPYGCD